MRKSGGFTGKNKYIFSFIVLIGLILLTFYILYSSIDAKSMKEIIKIALNTDKRYLLAGSLAMLGFLFCEGATYRILMRGFGTKIGLLRGFKYGCIDFFFSAITPSATGGQPVVGYYMSRDRLPVGQSCIALVMQTVLYKIVLVILGTFSIIFNYRLIFDGTWVRTALILFGFTVNLVVIFLCIVTMFSHSLIYKTGEKLIHILSRMHIIRNKEKKIEKLRLVVEEYSQSAVFIKTNFSITVKAFLCTFVQRISMFSVVYFVYRGMGFSQYSYFTLVGIQAAISIAVDSLPVPGAVGACELMFHAVFTGVFGPDAVVSGLLFTRGINYYFCLVVSSVFTLANHIMLFFKNKKEVGEAQ